MTERWMAAPLISTVLYDFVLQERLYVVSDQTLFHWGDA